MLLLYCCMVVSGLFTLVFGGDIVCFMYLTSSQSVLCLKKNQNAPRPSEHPPVMGKKCLNV